jgi:hypothetical protein
MAHQQDSIAQPSGTPFQSTEQIQHVRAVETSVQAATLGWKEISIVTVGTDGRTQNETTIRTRAGFPFVDLSITEYAGLSRRAKLTTVRLDDEAGRALLAACQAAFGQRDGAHHG